MPKQILSIDVGIKNLSFCLFEINTNTILEKDITVLKWDNIDLTKQDTTDSKCIYIDNPTIITSSKKKINANKSFN